MSAEAAGVGDPGRDDERARHETGDARTSLREWRRFDTTEHNLRSTLSKQTSGGTIDEALACQERKCFVSSGEGVSYPCIFFSRI